MASKITPEPAVVSESSPGKYHVIWPVEDMLPEKAEALLKAIALEFGGDTNAIDLARVLRIPGLKNHKYESRPEVEIVRLDNNTTRRKLAEFSLPLAPTATKSSAPNPVPTEDSEIPVKIDPELSIQQGHRDSTLASIGGALRNWDLSRDEIHDALSRINAEHVVPSLDSSDEVEIWARDYRTRSIEEIRRVMSPAMVGAKVAATNKALFDQAVAAGLI